MAGHIYKVGDPSSPDTVVGPVISQTAAERILGVVRQATRDGGRLVAGGERLGGEHAEGFFLPLTIVADVDNGSAIAQNEVFGPVLRVTPFDGEEEAIALANGTAYGLGAYVHTQNLRRAHHMAGALEAGMIQVNGSGEGMTPCTPFGGEAGLKEFLRISFGPARCAVQRCGLIQFHHSTEVPAAAWETTLAVNLGAPFHLSKAALPHLLKVEGAIVNVASSASFIGEAYAAAYCASKVGLIGFTKAMAMEYMHQPLRINAVAPGGMVTNIAANLRMPKNADMALIKRFSGIGARWRLMTWQR
jgi:NAD(P)-dependent dehydrogenase (short-subunit alcohol dehydrogenase family)